MNSLFISCHFDDAVYSCGKLISIIDHPTVLTVFGGIPENKLVLTAYDQKSGFDNAEQAILERRREDAVALTTLGAKQKYLDFVDHQYGEDTNLGDIEKELVRIIRNYDEIYLPLGFLHHDHDLVGSLLNKLIKRKNKTFYVFMDMPYYVDQPLIVAESFNKLPFETNYEFRGGDLGKKMLAIACYKSQVPITNLYHLMCDERFYKVKL